jgi:hypothetical protein
MSSSASPTNPYQSPTGYATREERSKTTLQVDPHRLRRIAFYQRGLMLSIAALVSSFFLIPIEAMIQLGLPLEVALLASWISCVVATGVLTAQLFGPAVGVCAALTMLLPLINMAVAVIVDGQATRLLRSHGVEVGFLGAKMRTLPD